MKLCLAFVTHIILCNALMDLTVDQKISDSGFHRMLSANITLYSNLTSCFLAVEEKFPRNVYLREEDVEKLEKNTKFQALLPTKLNIEQTVAEASPFSLYLYLNDIPITTNTEFGSQYLYNLKMHSRYHYPMKGGGYIEFEKSSLFFFARCLDENQNTLPHKIVEFPCNSHGESKCKWHVVPARHNNLLPITSIPIGNTNHYQSVFFSTHILSYFGLILILYSLF